jgi:hypothetical protein
VKGRTRELRRTPEMEEGRRAHEGEGTSARTKNQRADEEVELLEKGKRAAAGGMVGRHGEPCMQLASIDRRWGTHAQSPYVAEQQGMPRAGVACFCGWIRGGRCPLCG